MNIQNWKIFDKAGSQLNWSPDPLIQLIFDSPTGSGAEGFLVTDASGHAISAEITNGGYGYINVNDITLSYTYALGSGSQLSTSDASIFTKDVSIFGSNISDSNTQSISGLSLDLSTNFVYPSATYAAAIFLDPVSQGLVETEHLFIFDEYATGLYRRPYDASDYTLIMEFIGDDNEIQFFTVDENTTEITWTDAIVFDTSILIANTPLQVNIGFRSPVEGVYERILRIYHLVGNIAYTVADIVVNAESIGEDERLRTLITNFGLPDPKDMKDIFKQTDINEDLPDWEVLNYKSKHIILEHDKIMPFIGTYKGLINAIKWLGYDDVYIREWFLNVTQNTKLSLIVPYDAADRAQTILMFSPAQRKTLKKLNQLSLNYCITRETGNLDVYGTPETENCYEYNLKEVFVKLLGLKNWLEANIVGVNCRITDITGEGIYFERIQNLIYTTDNIGFNYAVQQTLTPYGPDHDSELVLGDASVRLTFLELTNTTIGDLAGTSFKDMTSYAWDPNYPSIYLDITDPSYLQNPDYYLLVGSSFAYPFINVKDIMWRMSTVKDLGGVLGNNVVTNPLFIYENEIRFYNTFDVSSVWFNASTNLTLLLEKAYLRDPSIDEWTNSIAYSIYPDPSKYYDYIMESSSGLEKIGFNDYAEFSPDALGKLQYAYDTNYKVPLLTFQYFHYTDPSGVSQTFGTKEYILDILDGKVYMNAGTVPNSSDNLTLYLNFNYDTSLIEQQITVNAIYDSPRMILFQFDPSAYYWADPSGKTGGNDPNVYLHDNSIYTMHVNHIGDYNIELFAWDEYNTMFYNPAREKYPVWIKTPTLYTMLDTCCNTICVSTYMNLGDVSTLIANNKYPIYDRLIALQGLTLEIDGDGNPYVSVPSITYFQDVPEPNSINRLLNLTERISAVSGTSITIDPDYQKFYSGDDVRIVKFDKGKYALIEEVSAHINTSSSVFPGNAQPTTATLSYACPFTIETSTNLYILNDTYRTVTNANNIGNKFTADISGYTFDVGQLVGLIINHKTNGYSWGSSYKVLNVNGSTHVFDMQVPEFFVSNPSVYTIKAKHAFSSYSDFTILTDTATEVANNFHIYLKNSYCQEYYLDDTFAVINILFDQDKVNQQWYNASDNLINSEFYFYDQSHPVNVDVSTLVILRSIYDDILINDLEWTLNSYDVFSSNKLDISTAIMYYSPVDWSSAKTRTFPIKKGDTIIVKANLTLNSGNTPYLLLADAAGIAGRVSQIPPIQYLYNGDNTVVLTAVRDSSAARLTLETYEVTDYSATISAYNNYMLHQKNIWTIINHDSSIILMKVFNDSVPYIFDTAGTYDVECVSYDSYGNAITKKYEGLIQVN